MDNLGLDCKRIARRALHFVGVNTVHEHGGVVAFAGSRIERSQLHKSQRAPRPTGYFRVVLDAVIGSPGIQNLKAYRDGQDSANVGRGDQPLTMLRILLAFKYNCQSHMTTKYT
jgi:hypothetical protein